MILKKYEWTQVLPRKQLISKVYILNNKVTYAINN